MNKFERYLYNQKTQNELKKLIERMLENEQKSRTEIQETREEVETQKYETRSQIVGKQFDDIEEVELCVIQ